MSYYTHYENEQIKQVSQRVNQNERQLQRQRALVYLLRLLVMMVHVMCHHHHQLMLLLLLL
jgi:hypothetical protein